MNHYEGNFVFKADARELASDIPNKISKSRQHVYDDNSVNKVNKKLAIGCTIITGHFISQKTVNIKFFIDHSARYFFLPKSRCFGTI